MQEPSVLIYSIRDGLGLLTWEKETFAYADVYDESAGRYRGLRVGQQVNIMEGDAGLLVQPSVARKQIDEDAVEVTGKRSEDETEKTIDGDKGATGTGKEAPATTQVQVLRRFHGTVELDPNRIGRDAGRIADEVVSHLTSLGGAKAKITLEIDIEIPNGIPQDRVRIVNENSNTLKFKGHGFEEE